MPDDAVPDDLTGDLTDEQAQAAFRALGDQAGPLVLAGVQMQLDDATMHFACVCVQAADPPALAYLVVRAITRLCAPYLPEVEPGDDFPDLMRLSYELTALERQGRVDDSRTLAAAVVHEYRDDLHALAHLVAAMLTMAAAFVRTGHLPWPRVHYQVAGMS